MNYYPQRCLVLGGGGFIGSHLCEALLENGHHVAVFERSKTSKSTDISFSERIEWIEGDFTKPKDIQHAIQGIDIVFHLISTTLPKNSNDNIIYDVSSNLISTLHLLEKVSISRNCKVIFVSSGGTVYGIPRQTPISEDHPTDPICSYGVTKLAIEKYLNLYYMMYGLEYSIIRLSNPYGERQRTNSSQGAIAVFLERALKGETIEIWGDGEIIRDYIYVGDVIRALMAVMYRKGGSRPFNIGSGQGRSLNELLEIIKNLSGRPLNCIYKPGRTIDVPVNVLSISRATNELNWKPQVSFTEGLEHTFKWMKNVSSSI